jgi:anaerobic magnesium-protoporphyrin IX monomethyl ester cyclase
MSAGHPRESEQTIRETYEWLLAVRSDDFDMTIISVYPGSPYYDDAAPHKRPGFGSTESIATGFTATTSTLPSSPITTKRIRKRAISPTLYRLFEADELVAMRDFVESDVRHRLGIPFNPSAAAIRYEYATGQRGNLPGYLLRTTTALTMAAAGRKQRPGHNPAVPTAAAIESTQTILKNRGCCHGSGNSLRR